MADHPASAVSRQANWIGKFALVIGNNDYPGAAKLRNAERDAREIAVKLQEAGFYVDTVFNGTTETIKEAITSTEQFLIKNKIETGLFFYSGHGIQIHDDNFVVPVDIDDFGEASLKLVQVKKITDLIAENCETCLIFLDACRNNPFGNILAESNTRTRSWENVSTNEFDSSGLAEFGSPTGTLIAFAAAPGKTATDHGELGHSPFTQALLKNISAVDLPLTNLLHRVSEEVKKQTNEAQQPWYHSSLEKPFFFYPGSLITLTGNLLALFAVVMALAVFATTFVDGFRPFLAFAGTATVALALSILIFGMHRAYQRLRGMREPDQIDRSTFAKLLLQRGVIGGALGGICIVPIIAFPYYRLYLQEYYSDFERCARDPLCQTSLEPIGRIAVDMVVAGVSVSSLLGFTCWFGASVFFKNTSLIAVSKPSTRHLFCGSIVGGISTGLIVGPIATTYFAFQERPIADPKFLAPFTIIASAIVVFALVNYSLERMSLAKLRRSLVGTLGGLAGGGAVAVAVFGPLYFGGVVDSIVNWMITTQENHGFHYNTIKVFLVGGLIYGFFLGIVLGSVFAFARYFTPGETAKHGDIVQEVTIWRTFSI